MQAVQPVEPQAPSFEFPRLAMLRSERWLVGAHILVAFTALSIGLLMGPFQAFRRAPMMQWETPIFTYYYQALTLHGVLNALVFTTFFIIGFSFFVTQRTLKRPLANMQIAWAAFVVMTIGVVLAGFAMLTGQANVLYTFYAPMLAHWTFYLGLTLVIVGTWLATVVIFMTYFQWRKDNPGVAVPLAVFGILANLIMWFTASLGVATEVLTMLLPMSLGLIVTTDPQVSRILFWFFGHPLVYFWLIPAYVSWYTMLPKQTGVKLFSDSMARVAFLMLMVFSIPIGVHHLFVDPGVSEVAKIMHSALTFVVAFPSLLTAFNIGATLERAGKKRGGNSFTWIFRQEWGNPVIAAQLCGMLLFLIGGITGLINASYSFNVAMHNSTWIVGHFHMTLAGAVFLTYMSILYWMLPIMRERKLWQSRLALGQVYTWFVGMLIFGFGMGHAGILGAIRRTDMGAAGAYINPEWAPWLNFSAIGGIVLLISSVLIYVVIFGTLFRSKEQVQTELVMPITTEAPKKTLMIFERWGLWAGIIVITNIVMWGPVLIQALNFAEGFWTVGVPMR